ncbi:MAG: hypothetical protein HFJ91_08160 [Muribaculaceae bacterium]|nr:hypothetical protein [Muribaculaceae bacterium]
MKLTFIALKVTRHSDSQSILWAYSRQLGRISLALPAGRGREANRMRALTMPLGVVECESETRSLRDILPMKQLRAVMPLAGVHSDPIKQMVAMFVAETLSLVLRGGGSEPALFDFLTESIGVLEKADPRRTANFPICFLCRLAEKLGVEPDTTTYTPGSMLDMREGIWRRSAAIHGESLGPADSDTAYLISRMTYGNMGAFRFSRHDRATIIETILRYYTIHVGPMSPMHTPGILHAML